jgi:transcriptional regulator with XRE-family HTH domain
VTADLAKTIGANITAARTAADLSMRELARALGVSQSSVHYWETAVRDITAVRLAAVAAALGVTVEQLLTDGWTPPVPTFGLRDWRVTWLGVGEPWATAKGADLAVAWHELITGREEIAEGDEVVRRGHPGEPWQVVGSVGENGVLVVAR